MWTRAPPSPVLEHAVAAGAAARSPMPLILPLEGLACVWTVRFFGVGAPAAGQLLGRGGRGRGRRAHSRTCDLVHRELSHSEPLGTPRFGAAAGWRASMVFPVATSCPVGWRVFLAGCLPTGKLSCGPRVGGLHGSSLVLVPSGAHARWGLTCRDSLQSGPGVLPMRLLGGLCGRTPVCVRACVWALALHALLHSPLTVGKRSRWRSCCAGHL